MRTVELHLRGWLIADAMAELRIWLDHNNCVPMGFDISKSPAGEIDVRVEFNNDAMAQRLQLEFAH